MSKQPFISNVAHMLVPNWLPGYKGPEMIYAVLPWNYQTTDDLLPIRANDVILDVTSVITTAVAGGGDVDFGDTANAVNHYHDGLTAVGAAAPDVARVLYTADDALALTVNGAVTAGEGYLIVTLYRPKGV